VCSSDLVPEALARKLEAGPGPHLERAEATVIFATIGGDDAAERDPLAVVALFDRVIGEIDEAAVAAGIERVKTIGATVLLASGVPTPDPDHLARAARFALAVRRIVRAAGQRERAPLTARVGLATGPVVWGVVGLTRYAFDLWGDTVNTASRLESHGAPGRIHVPAAVGEALRGAFAVEDRGEVSIKGKGLQRTAWLEDG
jgi:class 3 adenylate cyclase